MLEAAAQCFETFSGNSLVSICAVVLTLVKYLTGLQKIDSMIANIQLT